MGLVPVALTHLAVRHNCRLGNIFRVRAPDSVATPRQEDELTVDLFEALWVREFANHPTPTTRHPWLGPPYARTAGHKSYADLPRSSRDRPVLPLSDAVVAGPREGVKRPNELEAQISGFSSKVPRGLSNSSEASGRPTTRPLICADSRGATRRAEVIRARLEITAAFGNRCIPPGYVSHRRQPAEGLTPLRFLPDRAHRPPRCNGRTDLQTRPRGELRRLDRGWNGLDPAPSESDRIRNRPPRINFENEIEVQLTTPNGSGRLTIRKGKDCSMSSRPVSEPELAGAV